MAIIALVREVENLLKRNYFRSVYRLEKQLASSRKSFDVFVKDVNGRHFIYDDKQLKRWKEHFTAVLNRITSGEILPLLDEMTNHHGMRLGNDLPSRREIISAVNALKRNKAAEIDGLPAVIYRCTCNYCRSATSTRRYTWTLPDGLTVEDPLPRLKSANVVISTPISS